MSTVKLEKKDGKVFLIGDLTYKSVPSIIDENLLENNGDILVDLAGINHSDSSGLALLIQWFRQACDSQQQVKFENVPEKMLALAKVSNLDKVLPFVSH